MKKYIVWVLLLVFQCFYAMGERDTLSYPDFKQYLFEDFCDACGCSASGGSMGFSSMLDQNFVGIRYFNQSYSSRDGIFNNSPWIDENFNTVQLWAWVPVFKNFQVSVLMPYHSHNRELATGRESLNGIGDITLLGLYTIYSTKRDSAVFGHTLQGGGGIKLPTGKYNGSNNGSVNPSFQLGTGSWDYLLAAEYVIRRDKLGLSTMVNYTFKTKNDQDYQFGDQFNYGSTLFYIIEGNKVTVAPQAGFAGEVYASNRQYDEGVPDTKGDILFGKAGIEAGLGKFSLGLNAMLPINQNLTGGKVEANYRWSVNINYSL